MTPNTVVDQAPRTKRTSSPRTTAVIPILTLESTQQCDAPTGLFFGPSAVPDTFQKKNSTCGNTQKPTYEKSWPGQSCGKVGDDEVQVDCAEGAECDTENNVCKAKSGAADAECKNGEGQPSSAFCDVGLYCMPGDTPTCKAIIADGGDCTNPGAIDQCGLGSVCVKAGSEEKTTCQKFGSIKAGTQLQDWQLGDTGMYTLICEGGNILKAGTDEAPTYWCMTATKNNGDISTGVDVGAECATTQFTDTEKPTESSAGKTTAKCGFNQGGNAFCPLQTGDDQVSSAITSMVTTWTAKKTECPNGGNLFLCTKWDDTDKANVAAYQLQTSLVSADQGWPNVADNAGCIKDTYTKWFHGGNAATFGFAAVFAALSIVF